MTSTSFNSPGQPTPRSGGPAEHPLTRLSVEDLNLITEFVLASGSLKALAKTYGVSYPTIRNRLDDLIARVRAAVEGRPPDPVTEILAQLVERGDLTGRGARAILEAVRERDAGDAHVRAVPPGDAPTTSSSKKGTS